MTASVTSGFAPAALSTVTAGVASMPEGDIGEPGLFAALLSLLGPQPIPEGELTTPVTLSVSAVLPETPATPRIDAIDLPDIEAAAQTEQGKSLLKNLGDALIAINDALAAGKPIDPALEKKLGDSLDAVAVYLGTFAPPAPQIDPKITALASGDGILPQVAPALPDIPVIVAPPTLTPDPTVLPEAAAPEEAASEPVAPTPTSVAFMLPADAAADTEPTMTPTASTVAAATETPPTTVPAPLAKLGKLIEDLGNKLAAQSPELAAKLDTLARSLQSGAVPPELIAELSSDAEADPEIARIIEALAAPKPVAPKASAPLPFIAPSLVVPEAVAKSTKPEPTIETPPAAASLDTAEAEAPSDPDSVRRTAVLKPATPEPRPADSDTKPTAATASAPQPAATTDTSATSAPAPFLAAGAAAAARTIHAAYQVPVQQVNLPQVAFEVVRQFEAGSSRFQIRLDPAELGRIDVRLDVDKSGTINARMTVERPETLDLLQRDQRSLQQALQQAGLDGAKTNLEFSLRQNPFAQQGGMGDDRGDKSGFNTRGEGFAGGDDTAAETATTTYRGTASASGVNLFV